MEDSNFLNVSFLLFEEKKVTWIKEYFKSALITYLPQNKTDGIGPLVAFYSGLKGTILFGHLLRCNLGGWDI